MKVNTIPGATYGEFHPNGIGYTNLTIPVGSPELLHFRVSATGQVVGQGHTDGRAWYWSGTAWHDLGPTQGVSIGAFHPTNGEVYVSGSTGVRVYDSGGQFQRLLPGYIGSQGIRWIEPDGSIRSGDATYSSEFVHEYTKVGEILIGQGNTGGLVAVVQGKPKLIVPGDHRFVRVNQSSAGISVYSTDFRQGVHLTVTEEELKLLPEMLIPSPAPTPPSVPPPSPTPKPEVPAVSVPNQFSVVEQIRAKYPTPLGPRHPEFLVEVASTTGGKLLRKDSGTHVTLASGENVSQDIVVYGSTGVDILSDGEGAAKPVWQVKEGETFDASRLVSVSIVSDTHPAPIPGLPGPEVDMAKVSKAISEALAPLDERLNVIGLKVEEVAAQLEVLLKAPAKTPQTIKVQSSRAFGHSHSVTFVV